MTFIPNQDGRQCVAAAHIELTAADFDANDNAVEVALPDGAQVIAGSVNVTEAFNAATSDTLAVGTADDTDRYMAAKDAQTTGLSALTATGYQHTSSDSGATPPIVISRVTAGADATAGKAFVTIQYVVAGKAEWTQD